MSASDSMSFSYQQGTPVRIGDEPFGTLEDVITEPGSDTATALRVRRSSDGNVIDVPATYLDPTNSNDNAIVLSSDYDAAAGDAAQATGIASDDDADELIIPVREEVLAPVTRETDLGKVIIRKHVEDVPVSTSVDVERDQVAVERVEINQPIEAAPGPRQEGDTLIIPVVEEILVTEKRLMLREEIRITRQRITEAVAVDETLRREVVEFEERRGETMADTLDPRDNPPKTSS